MVLEVGASQGGVLAQELNRMESALGGIAVLSVGISCLVRLAWDDLGPQRGVGREHAMKANEMEPGTGD